MISKWKHRNQGRIAVWLGGMVVFFVGSLGGLSLFATTLDGGAETEGANRSTARPEPSFIDATLDQFYQQRGITPAETCTDREFLRRVTLDLAGRIPTVEELDAFLESPDRNRVIDRLLGEDAFNRSFAEVWTATLVGYADDDLTDRDVLKQWLYQQLKQDVPYDEIARRLITARGITTIDGPTNFILAHRDNPVVKIGRAFLGVRLDCAQCHDHPFDRWTQEDHEAMTRFFSNLDFQEVAGGLKLVEHPADRDPESAPVFLTGARARTTQWRSELAMFTTHCKPFARTFANRIWYQLMGRGIVDPPDDFSSANPPVVPDLIEPLAEFVRDHQYSVRDLVRLICRSRAYQRSSSIRSESPESAQQVAVFAIKPIKPMTVEQYYDSLVVALDLRPSRQRRTEFIDATVGGDYREDFGETWKYRETIQTALYRLSFRPRSQVSDLESLFLKTLGRPPTSREQELCRKKSATAIRFALIQSNEFFFNH